MFSFADFKKIPEILNLFDRVKSLEEKIQLMETRGERCPECKSYTIFLNPEVSWQEERITGFNLTRSVGYRKWVCENTNCNNIIIQKANAENKFEKDFFK
jgi:hypothetical protein